MPAQVDTTVRDATPLYDAARSLHGYFLFRWMREYLNVVLGNIHRWWRAGLLGAERLAEPEMSTADFIRAA